MPQTLFNIFGTYRDSGSAGSTISFYDGSGNYIGDVGTQVIIAGSPGTQPTVNSTVNYFTNIFTTVLPRVLREVLRLTRKMETVEYFL